MKSEDRKNKRIVFKVTENEYKAITDFAHDKRYTLAQTMRMMTSYFLKKDRQEDIFNKDSNYKKEVLYELRRYGNNLNQIAYKLNVALKTEDITAADLIEIRQACTLIKQIYKDSQKLNKLANKRF